MLNYCLDNTCNGDCTTVSSRRGWESCWERTGGRGWEACRDTFALLPRPPFLLPPPLSLSSPADQPYKRAARRAERVRPVCRSLSLLRARLGPPVPLLGASRSVRPGACRLPRARATGRRSSVGGSAGASCAARGAAGGAVLTGPPIGVARLGPRRCGGSAARARPCGPRIRAKICTHTFTCACVHLFSLFQPQIPLGPSLRPAIARCGLVMLTPPAAPIWRWDPTSTACGLCLDSK